MALPNVFGFYLSSDILPPYLCETDPVGFDAMKYAVVRDAKYHGVSFEVSLELTFVKKAGEYIRTVYEAQGSGAVVRLTVYEYNGNELRWEEVHTGRLDLTTYQSTARGVSATVKEAGIGQKLLNLDDVQVDLLRPTSFGGVALPALQLPSVLLHSQQILKRYAYMQASPAPAAVPSFITNQADQRFALLYFGITDPQGIDEFGVSEIGGAVVTLGKYLGDEVPIYTAKENGVLDIDLRIVNGLSIGRTGTGNGDFDGVEAVYYLRVGTQSPVLLATLRETNVGGTLNRDVVLAHSGSFPLAVGDPVFLYGGVEVKDISAGIAGVRFSISSTVRGGSYLKFSAATTTDSTAAPGLLVHEALSCTVSAITDQPTAVYSEYYGRTDTVPAYAADGPGSLRLVTSAFWMRGFPLADKPLFLSFRDLYESLDAIDCVGMGPEQRNGRQVVRVEPRAFFYPATTSLQLGTVSELRKVHAPEYLFNTAELGYTRWKSGSQNGLLEFNAKRTWVLPLSHTKNKYTALSPLATAGYLIEETRRDRYDATATQEGKADETSFLICLRRTADGGWVTERDEAFAVVGGLLSPSTTYNLRLSPGRMLRRHGAWLRAGLVKRPNPVLQRGAFEGFDGLVTRLNTELEIVDERQHVPATALPAPCFQPETYRFTARLRWAELKRLRAAPYGRVSFLDHKGQRLSGYLLRLDYTPATRLADFTLLRAD